MKVFWVKTDKHVYGAIYREHSKQFTVFGTVSAPEGDPTLGLSLPYMLTEWGFKDAGAPLIRLVQTKDSHEQKDWDYQYYIANIDEE